VAGGDLQVAADEVGRRGERADGLRLREFVDLLARVGAIGLVHGRLDLVAAYPGDRGVVQRDLGVARRVRLGQRRGVHVGHAAVLGDGGNGEEQRKGEVALHGEVSVWVDGSHYERGGRGGRRVRGKTERRLSPSCRRPGPGCRL